jgi:hypothetical protein
MYNIINIMLLRFLHYIFCAAVDAVIRFWLLAVLTLHLLRNAPTTRVIRPLDNPHMTTKEHISKHSPPQIFLPFPGFYVPFLALKTLNLTYTTRHGSSLAALDCALNALLFEHITTGGIRGRPNGYSACA